LSEVEQMCSHVIVMNGGRLVVDGAVHDLVGTTGTVYVEVDDDERARAVLAALPNVTSVRRQGDGLVVQLRDGRRSDLATALMSSGIKVETLMATQRLEDAFLELLAARAEAAPAPERAGRFAARATVE